jgi:general secretion pathway protein G
MTIDTDINLGLGPDPRAGVARKLAARGSRGMTLIEILVVLAIIGLIMGGIAVAAFNAFDDSKLKAAANDIVTVSQGVQMYKMRKNKCPKSVQDLKAAGVLERAPKDPWGAEYVIKCPGEHGAIDVSSAGPDGQIGNEDDINSWDDPSDEAEKKES